MQNKVVIIGCGLVGSLWAYLLKKNGFDVEVYEKRPHPKNLSAPAGRSINLVITSRGLHGLATAGLAKKILPITVPVYGRQIHTKTNENIFQPYGRDKSECNYSVSRWDLNKALIQACEDIGVKTFFEHEITQVNFTEKKISFKTPQGLLLKNYTKLFATDGAGSVVRKELVKQHPEQYQEKIDWLDSDYKELYLPKKADQTPALEKNALHIWPRGTHMMMGLANADNSFTMTLYLPNNSHAYSFENLKTVESVNQLFQSEFSDSIQLIPNFAKEFLENPQGKLATVKLNKWVYQDSVAFLGDAAHAIVPFFGQGMNLGFEDCTTFLKIFNQSEQNWEKAFSLYDQQQRPNANAIADMALENFVEMRDKVSDSHFQFKKKIEGHIEKYFPELYRSRYGLITYTLTPYQLAQEMGHKQSQFLEKCAQGLTKVENLNLDEIKKELEINFLPWMQERGIETKSYRLI